ncbi:MAG TPA: metal transporter [Propylenella sp.]|nr:metal transporter [Propylenella sp.]
MQRPLLWLLLPLVVLAALIAVLVGTRPLDRLSASAPPVESIAVEGARLMPGLITLSVRADGSGPTSIAQVQVDGAYRSFSLDPDGPIDRLGTAEVAIPYPWVDGEAHHVVLLTGTGAAFEHSIEVAQETPRWEAPTIAILALVGVLLGLAPVAAGMLAYPGLKRLPAGAMRFVLALTVGLLVFLLIDTLGEGLEAAEGTLERLHVQSAFLVSALITAGVLLALGRREGRAPEGFALAAFMALGIGLHNLGEGLAVGAALAAGEAALATFLVIGFTLHNVSEGVAIAAPLVGTRPRLLTFAGLAALAGLPAVPGVWLGAQAVSPLWVAICFGIGAGAILQVIIEVAALLWRRGGRNAFAAPASVGGVAAGLAVMYFTALLV